MACSDYADGVEALQDYAFFDAIACYYTDAVGTLLTGLLVFGGINILLYFRYGGITANVVLTLLVGGAILPLMPGPAQTIAVLVLLFGIAIGPPLFLRRMGV